MSGGRTTSRDDITINDARIEVVKQAQGAPHHELHCVQGPGSPKTYRLILVNNVIGRSDEAEIIIDSVDLSRKHALVQHANGSWSVRDLDSRNGVFLNGVKIHSAVLQDGDTVQLGSVVFLFREVKG